MTLQNLVAYSGQLVILVGLGVALPSLLRITAPSVRHAYWRVLLAFALLLPWLQSRQPVQVSTSATIELLTAASPSAGAARGWEHWDWTSIALVVFGVGVVLRIAVLAIGLVRLRRLRSAGYLAPACDEHDDAQQVLETTAEIRYVAALGQPVTFGLLRPVVLLPESLRARPPEIERAVLYHELLHVQRRDWMWLMIEEGIRIAFWFHPAMWLLISRVQQSREEVVDELSVMATGSRRAYIEALVQFAGASEPAPVSTFAQRRQLFQRILLLSHSRVMSSTRVTFACAIIALALTTGRSSAVAAFPLLQPAAETEAADVPLATVVAPVVSVVANPSAAGVTPLERSRPAARRPRSETRRPSLETPVATTPTRSPAPAPGPSPETTSSVAESTGVPAIEAGEPDRVQPLRVGGGIRPPIKVRDVKPAYPPIAQSARVSGIVILEATVGANGRVDAARVLRSIPLLDQAALDAVSQWEFAPTYLNGNPVPIVMTVTVNFALEG